MLLEAEPMTSGMENEWRTRRTYGTWRGIFGTGEDGLDEGPSELMDMMDLRLRNSTEERDSYRTPICKQQTLHLLIVNVAKRDERGMLIGL